MALKKVLLALFSFILLLFPNDVFASSEEFVTIINPVRISRYTKDPRASVASQYEVVRGFSLPATWLLTSDVLTKEDVVGVFRGMDAKQELGIFLEVTPAFAKEAQVEYHETGFWHHATSVFLSGYKQEERIRLIDTVFEKFKETFGYFPKAVGSWWTDAFSLSYIKEKYGVDANLGLADQYSTDGYQVWGSPWQVPFYSSKYHTGIPASSQEVKLDVVTLQWAPRDPYNGYKNSLYSTQDYSVARIGLTTEYFEKLLRLYAKKNKNPFGQIVVGLEGDLESETYKGEFQKQLELISELSQKGEITVSTMGDFADWYRGKYPGLSPSHFFESEYFLGKERIRVFWYQSPKFRIGILYNEDSRKVRVFDFRSYHQDLQEPYFTLPNKQFELSIYVPSYLDEVTNPEDVWEFSLGELLGVNKEGEIVTLSFGGNENIVLSQDRLLFPSGVRPPVQITESKALETDSGQEGYEIKPKPDWIIGREGKTFRNLTSKATHFLATKRGLAVVLAGILIFLGVNALMVFSRIGVRNKIIFPSLVTVIGLLLVSIWYFKNSEVYLVSQAEVDTLTRLSFFPEGEVLVYDQECLWCSFETKDRPAAFANKRSYVQRLGKHPIVYSVSVFTAQNQKEARREFEKLGVDYIYIVKYEDYAEKTPFSPGDLGIEKVYANANSELWRVKK
ncbi:MAG: hypothetical protein ACOYT7_03845 [Patescibacteria group bacterium]